jgi:hypothetical protein
VVAVAIVDICRRKTMLPGEMQPIRKGSQPSSAPADDDAEWE